MGLSSDPEKAARQREALAAGRRKLAERIMAEGAASPTPPRQAKARSSQTAKAGKRTPGRVTFAGDGTPPSQPKPAKPKAARSPKPAPARRAGAPVPAPAEPSPRMGHGRSLLHGMTHPLG